VTLLLPKRVKRGRIDKSVLTISEPARVECKAHIAWLHGKGCCVPGCRRGPIVVHHPTTVQLKARGLRCGDDRAVPLCAPHHDARSDISVHYRGDERAWCRDWGVDFDGVAAALWAESLAEGIRKGNYIRNSR
jgi:hypothetical protein